MIADHRIVRSIFEGEVYSRPWSHIPPTQVIYCVDHGQGEDAFICNSCAATLADQLADVPALLVDLELALTRQTHWVESGSITKPDESPLPFDERASRAITALASALGCRFEGIARKAALLAGQVPKLRSDPSVERLAIKVSDAVALAHRVIERPPEACYYGECPTCHADIYDERNVAEVRCSDGSCPYRAKLADHQLACLNAGEDRWLTVSELVGAITMGGETVNRHQINGWIRHLGLVRERVNRPMWTLEHGLVSVGVYVYRLGDVRALAQAVEDRRAS